MQLHNGSEGDLGGALLGPLGAVEARLTLEPPDWLNERTDEETRFFGVQIGAVRIGDSEAAPLLDVVAKPNDWRKQVRAATRAAQITGRGKLDLDEGIVDVVVGGAVVVVATGAAVAAAEVACLR